jgi:hypothetical protein
MADLGGKLMLSGMTVIPISMRKMSASGPE